MTLKRVNVLLKKLQALFCFCYFCRFFFEKLFFNASKMSFISSLEKVMNKAAFTENGAISYKSTLSCVLDFFSKSGALRGDEQAALALFSKAFSENKLLAKRALFYCRDIRGGQGERSIFRFIINYLAKQHPKDIISNICYIPIFGRWDDLYSLVDTPLEEVAFNFMKDQLDEDIKNYSNENNISLLAKWLKSENTSSEESRRLARITRRHFGMNSKEYRKTLSKLRTKIGIIESKMTQDEWELIDYSKIPSRAMKLYSKAFMKHNPEGFSQYLKSVSEGKKKINASTLYPYDIVSKYLHNNVTEDEDKTYELLWDNLPNYFNDGEYNTFIVVDVSGSMYNGCNPVKPIDVAISLGLYMAERNKGKLKNYFMTFSEEPELVKIVGDTLKQRIKNMTKAKWGYNTDIIKIFDIFIKVMKANNLEESEIPKKIFIISDMQFDRASPNNDETTFETIKSMFRNNNITRPDLIFWNVNAKSDTPVTKDDNGTFLVSGASPSILSHALNTKATSPVELMMEVLNSERYKCIN